MECREPCRTRAGPSGPIRPGSRACRAKDDQGPGSAGPSLAGSGYWVPESACLVLPLAPSRGDKGWVRPRPWGCSAKIRQGRSVGHHGGHHGECGPELGLRVPWIRTPSPRVAHALQGRVRPRASRAVPDSDRPMSDPSRTVEGQGASSPLPYAPVQRPGR